MARVEIPAPGDLVIDAQGNVLSGRSVTLKVAGTSTDATHYSALTGGTSTTAGLTTLTDGTIGASGVKRYVDEGSYDLTIAGRTRQIEASSGKLGSDLSMVATYGATREKVETFVIGANAVGVTTYYPLKIVDREIRITGMTITNATTLTLSAANWWSVRPKNFRDAVEQDILDNTEWGNVGTYILGAADVTTITANLSYILPSTFSQYASMRPGDILKLRLASNGTPTALSGFVFTLNYREL